MKKNVTIPIVVGIAIIILGIIVGIIATYNQESEISKSNDEINLENKTSENPIIDEKLNEIEREKNENYFQPAKREWITSGPFSIDRSKYLIGEKIFLLIAELDPNEKGQVVFLRPQNETHYTVHQTIPFDGMKKTAFNFYTDVRLSQQLGTCSIEDIVGEWTVVFRGTDYENLKFEFINEILPGEEDSFIEPVC